MVESGPFIEYCGAVYVHEGVVHCLLLLAILLPIVDFVIVHLAWPRVTKHIKKPQG